MRQKKKVLAVILTGIPVLTLMIMIFYFSAQEAAASERASGGIVGRVIALLYPHFVELSAEEQAQIEHILALLIRKSAHLTEYLLLGAALMAHVRAIDSCRRLKHPKLIAFLIGTVYAASDELHQLFVPGRSGELTDTMLDGLGVLLGVLLLSILLNRRRKGRTEA